MLPTLILVLALIFRMLNPALKLSLRTSLKFRMGVLFADISFPKKTERIVWFDKQCVRRDSGNLNSYSGMLNTDSGKSRKVFSLKPESVFKLNQNRCSG
jgi:hypothetical protein